MKYNQYYVEKKELTGFEDICTKADLFLDNGVIINLVLYMVSRCHIMVNDSMVLVYLILIPSVFVFLFTV